MKFTKHFSIGILHRLFGSYQDHDWGHWIENIVQEAMDFVADWSVAKEHQGEELYSKGIDATWN